VIFAEAASWSNYLPAVLQESTVYTVAVISLAIVGIAENTIPDELLLKKTYVQLASLVCSVFFSIGLARGAGIVYAIGLGVIASWGSTSTYDMVFAAIIARIRAFLGFSAPAPLSVPRNSTPQSKKES
jgi:hypothetical protein